MKKLVIALLLTVLMSISASSAQLQTFSWSERQEWIENYQIFGTGAGVWFENGSELATVYAYFNLAEYGRLRFGPGLAFARPSSSRIITTKMRLMLITGISLTDHIELTAGAAPFFNLYGPWNDPYMLGIGISF